MCFRTFIGVATTVFLSLLELPVTAKPYCTPFLRCLGCVRGDNASDSTSVSAQSTASTYTSTDTNTTTSPSSATRDVNALRIGYATSQRFANPVDIGGATLYTAIPQDGQSSLAFLVELHGIPNYTDLGEFVANLDNSTIDTIQHALRSRLTPWVEAVSHASNIHAHLVSTTWAMATLPPTQWSAMQTKYAKFSTHAAIRQN